MYKEYESFIKFSPDEAGPRAARACCCGTLLVRLGSSTTPCTVQSLQSRALEVSRVRLERVEDSLGVGGER